MIDNMCRICGNGKENKSVTLKGSFYGTKGEFEYFICDKCGCLQIADVPDNLSDYYNNESYYSFNMDKRSLKNKLLFAQMKNQIDKRNLLGKLVEVLYPVDYSYYNYASREKWILDVGCGQGEMLCWLSEIGYKHLEGVDPFLDKDISYDNGVVVHKAEVTGFKPEHRYGLITFVHAIEHIFDEKDVLQEAVSWLEDDGKIAVVFPQFSKYYWEKYGPNLHTLDPPRHFFIHSYDSIVSLFEECGMKLTYFDTRFCPSIPWMARNNRKNQSEKNDGAHFVLDGLTALFSISLRLKLRKDKDGAIAVAVFEKIHQ